MNTIIKPQSFKSRLGTLLGSLLLSLTLALSGSALALEIWTEPAKQDANTNIGNWGVVKVWLK